MTVPELKKALKKIGYFNGPINADLSDDLTKAVILFQQENALKADGVVGHQTVHRIESALRGLA